MVYAVLASGSMVFIGRRFVTVSEKKNQAEAEYRYVLTRLSENGESIAVLGGEGEERNGVDASLRNVLRRWRDICLQTMRTTIVSQTSSYSRRCCRSCCARPSFSMARCRWVRSCRRPRPSPSCRVLSTGWWTTIRDWRIGPPRPGASSSLMVSLDNLEGAEESEASGESSAAKPRRRRCACASVGYARGRHRSGQGCGGGDRARRTGAGRRRIRYRQEHAGSRDRRLWPWGEGKVEVASGTKLFLMPQRAYVPVGTLRRAATYPEPAKSKSVAAVAKAFKTCRSRPLDRADRRRGAMGPDACPAARSSVWRSHEYCCTGPRSSCWTRRLRRSTLRARTS